MRVFRQILVIAAVSSLPAVLLRLRRLPASSDEAILLIIYAIAVLFWTGTSRAVLIWHQRVARQGRVHAIVSAYDNHPSLLRPFLRGCFGPSLALAHAEALQCVGRGVDALALLDNHAKDDELVWFVLNQRVCTLTALGRYAEALVAANRRPTWRSRTVTLFALVETNAAEALYNQGLWEDAWRRLQGLDDAARAIPIAATGLALQRAWILSHWGRSDDARAALKNASRSSLPLTYQSEWFFTHAVVCLAANDQPAARHMVNQGLSCAIRSSSTRNGLFLLARVARVEGMLDEAALLCAQAASHSHRTQGGDGLLLWGDILAEKGLAHDARNAWALCIARDVESESATVARSRLSAAERPS